MLIYLLFALVAIYSILIFFGCHLVKMVVAAHRSQRILTSSAVLFKLIVIQKLRTPVSVLATAQRHLLIGHS